MLSILITHYKTLPLLKLCLRSMGEHCSGIEPKEIFVLDSAAEEETAEALREQFPAVRHVPFRENVGYVRLVNEGLRLSSGEHIFICHPDVVFTPGAVRRLLAALDEEPSAGIAAPRLLSFNGDTLQTCFRFYTPGAILGRRTFLKHFSRIRKAADAFVMADVEFQEEKVWPVGWAQGSALMVRREAFRRVGFLDGRFFMYFEDVDWCRRFWENGYTVLYVPGAKLLHWNIQSSRRFGGLTDVFLNRYTRIHILSAVKYFLKHGIVAPRFGV